MGLWSSFHLQNTKAGRVSTPQVLGLHQLTVPHTLGGDALRRHHSLSHQFAWGRAWLSFVVTEGSPRDVGDTQYLWEILGNSFFAKERLWGNKTCLSSGMCNILETLPIFRRRFILLPFKESHFLFSRELLLTCSLKRIHRGWLNFAMALKDRSPGASWQVYGDGASGPCGSGRSRHVCGMRESVWNEFG